MLLSPTKTEGEALTTNQTDRTVHTETPTVDEGPQTVRTESRRTTTTSPGRPELTRRIVVLVFGLIQVVVGLRIVLLLLGAREGNALVSGILDVSQVFVAPFEGILQSDALSSAGSTLDIAAIVAFVGWTLIEVIVLWAVGIFRREPA
jgi:hypothetical protein